MKVRRKRGGPITVPVASMGDIAFLLIIFFMVCSNFTRESNVSYKPPQAVDVVIVQDANLSVVVDSKGKIFLNGKEVDTPADLQSELESRLQDKTDPEARSVLFKCDLKQVRKDFQPALEAIVTAGGVVVAVGEKRKTY